MAVYKVTIKFGDGPEIERDVIAHDYCQLVTHIPGGANVVRAHRVDVIGNFHVDQAVIDKFNI